MRTIGILLAAGQSLRFGPRDKLLADAGGRPLVTHAAAAMTGAGLDGLIAVVSSERVAMLLPGFAIARIEPGAPQSAALHAGLAAARRRQAERIVVALGDMPSVTAALYRDLIALADGEGRAAMTDGARTTPPVVFTKRDFASLAALDGDRGAGVLIRNWPASALLQVDPGTLDAIDTADALAAFNSAHQRQP